jgi:hypothetical protein
VQSKRHSLDTSKEWLNPVYIFDKEESLPAVSRGVEQNPLCSKKAMMDFIEIPHIYFPTF